ncbi:hypothetical protein ACET3Z_029528 [Daucus carota]
MVNKNIEQQQGAFPDPYAAPQPAGYPMRGAAPQPAGPVETKSKGCKYVVEHVLGKSSVFSAAMSVAQNNTILWSLDRQYYYLSDDHASSM